jgi:hypothetical protein
MGLNCLEKIQAVTRVLGRGEGTRTLPEYLLTFLVDSGRGAEGSWIIFQE